MSMVSGTPTIDLVKARYDAGYSRRGLAKHLGLHPETIMRAETGEPISPASAKKIADFYGKTVSKIWPFEAAAA